MAFPSTKPGSCCGNQNTYSSRYSWRNRHEKRCDMTQELDTFAEMMLD
ncbi:unnamed protein product, partial [marine sediment metagenome]